MIRIFDLYEKVKGRFNVHQGGHIKPSKFVEWVDDSQIDLFNELVKEFQLTQQISDKLSPFLISANVLITAKSGFTWDLISKPTGYEYFASARIVKKGGMSCACKGLDTFDSAGKKLSEVDNTKCKFIDPDEIESLQLESDSENCEVPITLVDNDRWGAICDHRTKKPTKNKPIISQFSEGYKIAPKAAAYAIIMDFFKRPVKPVFNFTVTNPGTETEYYQYESTGSVDLEWSEVVIEDLMVRIQKKYATFTGRDDMYSQAVNDKKDIA